MLHDLTSRKASVSLRRRSAAGSNHDSGQCGHKALPLWGPFSFAAGNTFYKADDLGR